MNPVQNTEFKGFCSFGWVSGELRLPPTEFGTKIKQILCKQALSNFILCYVSCHLIDFSFPVVSPLDSPRVTLSTLGRWEYGTFLYTCSMIFSFTCEMVSQFSTLTGVTSGPSPCTSTCRVWQVNTCRQTRWDHAGGLKIMHKNKNIKKTLHTCPEQPAINAYRAQWGDCCYGNWAFRST